MSFKKTDNQNYYNPIRRGILNYEMILPNERVAIGLSGGKDSTSLLYFLDTIKKQKRLGFDFDIVPICLDMDMGMDLSPLKELCASLGYELTVVPTHIAPIVFDIRKESSPCSLCAKLRRGILYKTAQDLNCQKVALGHHLDDAIETYFMNFLFHGKMESFEPKSYLTKTNLSLIRPLIYLEEEKIKSFVKREELPVIFNPCPADKKTKREEVKHFIEKISEDYPDLRHRFIQGMEQGSGTNLWETLKVQDVSHKI